jgi:predicted unusual protein kinase regulating ubiquinone biosynthesis (AarF/ABC1/UbiB family)
MKIQRLASIGKVFAEEGLGQLTGQDMPGVSPDAQTAARLRRTLERLGPTFVKFGQMLATRVDLFSEEFTAELGKLHSSVPPFAHDVAMKIVEDELGTPVGEAFAEISAEPLAAASIAQVYKGKLKDGTTVAIKVQRPDLESSLLQDLDLLMQVSGWLDKLVPSYGRAMIHTVAKEYAHRSKQEIQFLAEAAAIERFTELWDGEKFFVFPKVFRHLCSDRLVVMEWMDGVKLDKLKGGADLQRQGFDPREFARHMIRLQVCMSYEHGFVHADTHPGNLILLPTGQVALIDFGLHSTISKALRAKVLEALYYQSQGRIDEQIDATIEFSYPADPKDVEPYKADLRELMKRPMPKTGAIISKQLIEALQLAAKYKSVANSELLMIIRNITIVEGIILRYCPDLEPEQEMLAVVTDVLKRGFSFEKMQSEIAPLLGSIALTLSRRPELMERLMKIERTFASSKNLGEFLRKEGVLGDKEEPRRSHGAIVAAFLLGVIAAYAALKLSSG